MHEATLNALAAHGEMEGIRLANGADCEEVLAEFANAKIDVTTLAVKLQDEGAKSNVTSWQ